MEVHNETGLKAGWCIGCVPPLALSATLLVKGTFALKPGAAAATCPPDKQDDLTGDVHRDEDPEKSLVYASDFALFKPKADLLLVGSCFPPGGRPALTCPVSFSFGSWSKKLVVVGERTWSRGLLGAPTPPEPFTSMNLDWDHAFGGSGYARNPLGRGVHEEELPGGGKARRLPCVEDPRHPVVDPGNRPEPAGFAPIPPTWRQRMSKVGTYDKGWLKEKWPWHPRDFDWTYFNAAPEDQQIEMPLRGDETAILENLHPDHPRLEARLPGLRPRWFLRESRGGDTAFREIPLRLDTLWIDAAAEKMILVWRGVAGIQSKKMKEVLDHLIVTEPVTDRPRPESEYADLILRRRRQKEEARKVAPPPFMPADFPVVPPPSLDWVAGAEAEFAGMEKDLVDLTRQRQEAIAAAAGMFKEQGLDPSFLLAPSPEQPDLTHFQVAQQAHQRLLKRQPEAAAVFPKPTAKDFEFKEPEPPPEPEAEPDSEPARREWTRELCVEHAAAGGSFAGEDLSGLDLSALDFTGLDFAAAVLAETALARATFSRARLDRAVLAGADLTGARLDGAELRGSDLSGARLTGADLRKAVLEEADLSGVKAGGARFDEAAGRGSFFYEADLTGARFIDADFSMAEFDGALLNEADFTRVRLGEGSLAKARGPGISFVEADLTKVSASESDFTGARFTGIKARESIWDGALLPKADFTGADLARANFDAAVLTGARFLSAELREARLPEADLRGANLSGVNLFRGTLEGADLTQAVFRGANLYEVEFYQARLDNVDFGGANLKGTKLA